MNEPAPNAAVPGEFVTTRWTLVLRARGETAEARSALGELCEAYWQPVFRFLLAEGKDPETARDLTQGFFARLLATDGLRAAEAAKGRFRSYLLGALRHFLADHRKQEARIKRGGGTRIESLNATSDLGSDTVMEMQVEDPSATLSDTRFDREWALEVMRRALMALELEFAAGGKERDYELLKSALTGSTDSLSPREVAAALRLSEGAVRVAIHRLRKRFRELIRKELAQTVRTAAEVEEELRYLAEVLASPPAG